MKYINRILFLAFVLFSIPSNAQNKELVASIERNITQYMKDYSPQKVYIQTDRDLYYFGDTLYFKSYILSGTDFKIDKKASLILLDIIDENATVRQRFMIKNKNGMGQGSVVLSEHFTTGNYQLVAYTPSMKNQNKNFFFQRNFYFVGSSKIDSIYKTKLKEQPGDVKQKKRKRKRLVAKLYLESKNEDNSYNLLLKLNNKLNESVIGKGFLNLNKQKINFNSNNEGLCKLTNINIENFPQTIKIELDNGMKSKTKLQNSKTILFNTNNTILKCNLSKTKDSRFLAIVHYGKLLKLYDIKDKNSISISKLDLRQGISTFIVLSNSRKILYSSTYFIPYKKEKLLKITKENNFISIENNSSLSLHLSLSQYNQDKEIRDRSTSILSQVLINEEQKQFTSLSQNTENYIYPSENVYPWESIFVKKWSTPRYSNEDTLIVSGKIIRFMSIGLPNKTVRLSKADDYYNTSVQQTNKKGRFEFQVSDESDSIYYIIDAVKPQGRNNLYIDLDTAEYMYLPFRKELAFTIPKNKYKYIDTLNQATILIANSEVERLKKERDKLNKKSSSGKIYGNADYTIIMTDAYKSYSNILDIISTAPGVNMVGGQPVIRGISSISQNIYPLVLVDNVPTTLDILSQISPTDVHQIDILKSPSNLAMFGSRGGNGVIAVITNKGQFNTGFIQDFTIPGFAKVRPFIPPTKKQIRNKKAYTTLWLPEINLKKSEKIQIPIKKGLKIKIEGISDNGKLISEEF